MSGHAPSSSEQPWVLGLSLSHNGAACLMRGREIVVAVQEERLTRKKRERLDPERRSLAVQYCLGTAGIGAHDLAAIGVCSQLHASRARGSFLLESQLAAGANGTKIFHLSHHAGHAVHAFATSGFGDAGVLVIDGMGSPAEDLSAGERRVCVDEPENGWEQISLYRAEGARLTPLEKHLVAKGEWLDPRETGMASFRSLGGMYSAVARQIFGEEMDAGHVMGLAAYGIADIPAAEFFTIENEQFRFRDSVPGRFRHNRRWPDHERAYENLAASVQGALEEAVLHLAARLASMSGSKNLCYAGGVALNVTTNERLHRETPFRDIYIPAAAEDSGPAIGAAFHALWQITGTHMPLRIHSDSLGRSYSTREIDGAILETPGLHMASSKDVLGDAAERLARGEIGGWFNGGAELGPRALGNRSILADPRDPETKNRLNARVKFRQGFRPFAPAILGEHVDAWFERALGSGESEFMLRAWKVRDEKKALVPAIVHADGTGRAQTVDRTHLPRFHTLITKFGVLTGVPMLVNTSFNVNKEPIVETPDDALWCFLFTGMDFCVLEDRLVVKAEGRAAIRNCRPRLIARDIKTGGAALSAQVETPWGPRGVELSPKVLPLLEVLDGKKRISEIAESLRRATSEPISEDALVELFASLRRLRVVSLSGQ